MLSRANLEQLQQGNATWSCNMGLQQGNARWSRNMGLQHATATWSCNMGLQHGNATWFWNMGLQQFNAIWSYNMGLHQFNATWSWNTGLATCNCNVVLQPEFVVKEMLSSSNIQQLEILFPLKFQIGIVSQVVKERPSRPNV